MTKILKSDLELHVLKEFLHYCPITGNFTYLKKTGKKAIVGNTVGHFSKRDGHIEIRFFGSLYRANRLAWFYMTGNWPEFVDHIDHNETNNSWNNLRNVNQKTNNMNMSRKRTNTSGVTGVWWSNQKSAWIAEIMLNGVKKHLGVFQNISNAAKARKEAERVMGFHPNHGMPK